MRYRGHLAFQGCSQQFCIAHFYYTFMWDALALPNIPFGSRRGFSQTKDWLHGRMAQAPSLLSLVLKVNGRDFPPVLNPCKRKAKQKWTGRSGQEIEASLSSNCAIMQLICCKVISTLTNPSYPIKESKPTRLNYFCRAYSFNHFSSTFL